MNFQKQLSNRYLKDAKILGYTWMDLLKRVTRQKVINKVIKYKSNKVIDDANNARFNQLMREYHIQQMRGLT